MLRFSQFLKEIAELSPPPAPQLPKNKAHLGMMIEPEEEATYQAIVAQNIDDPDSPEIEQATGNIGWHETNKAVANYRDRQLMQMRAQAGL